MSEQKPRVTIVGLGLVGASIGMALRQSGMASLVVGHDKDSAAGNSAKKLGAVDKTDWMLIPACEKADLVILALPASAVEETLRAIGSSLRPGCVVMDTASLKAPVLAWADELLPAHVHFVGGDPVLGGTAAASPAPPGEGTTGQARADLFKDKLFCVIPSPRADSNAVKLAIDLVTILGAKPLFHDSLEHDGLMAAVDQLPALLSLALLDTTTGQPMWRELRKLAGTSFEAATTSAPRDPLAWSRLCSLNRDNLVRWIDSFSASLALIRDGLEAGQAEALGKQWQEAVKERDKWLQLQSAGSWDEISQPEMPPKQSLLQPLLGGLVGRKPKPKP